MARFKKDDKAWTIVGTKAVQFTVLQVCETKDSAFYIPKELADDNVRIHAWVFESNCFATKEELIEQL